MGQNAQKMEKVMSLLFEHPERSFKIREISKKTNIPKTTVQRYLKNLKKQKIVNKENKLIVNEYTKFLKASALIKKTYCTGLITYLEQKLTPQVIIIFGSVRKGEYDKESDIDLFIESTKRTEIDISAFEKKLKHKLQLFIESDIHNLPKELFNNVLNAIKLSGYLKVK